ncbi:MAG TPA: Gfo/Idh/MocA family oxidoreductase [Saprospiraceae bacterium]|nr:Gfo/Idh/MocA family oxidoreductase [Saprospiraceae bacterium]
MKKFGLIGASGYVAPRHLQAIKETGNDLVVALDKSDSVGILDRYFPKASFFTEFERFDRHLEKEKRDGRPLDYISICSPNYLHDAHIRYGLRQNVDVICEKPLVLNPWNIDGLAAIENESVGRVNCILQLRLHPSVVKLKQWVDQAEDDKVWDIDLTYIAARGNWYYASWKGEVSKSGGITTNIGIHFFDMLNWVFGPLRKQQVHIHSHDRAAGYLELSRARVRWFLSINGDLIPPEMVRKGQRTYRSLKIGDEAFDFSTGFVDLHTESYRQILAGKGFSINDAKPAIEIGHDIRNALPVGLHGDYHPFAKYPLASHPFRRDVR